jgi:hypothetical protein
MKKKGVKQGLVVPVYVLRICVNMSCKRIKVHDKKFTHEHPRLDERDAVSLD